MIYCTSPFHCVLIPTHLFVCSIILSFTHTLIHTHPVWPRLSSRLAGGTTVLFAVYRHVTGMIHSLDCLGRGGGVFFIHEVVFPIMVHQSFTCVWHFEIINNHASSKNSFILLTDLKVQKPNTSTPPKTQPIKMFSLAPFKTVDSCRGWISAICWVTLSTS